MRREPGGLDTSWARSAAAGAVRELLLRGVLGPLIDLYTRRRVDGHEHLAALERPVLFVAMERVRLFFEESGAVTTPDKRVAARSRRAASPPSAAA